MPAPTDPLAAARDAYAWAYDWPPGVATCQALPKGEDYSALYVARALAVYAEIAVDLAAVVMEGVDSGALAHLVRGWLADQPPESFRERLLAGPKAIAAELPATWPKQWTGYDDFFQTWAKPYVVQPYHGDPDTLDRLFAWERVGGVNPMMLTRVDRLPDHLAVDAARFARGRPGDTLDAALAERRLYLCDYAALAGVPVHDVDGVPKYLTAPLALFCVDTTGTLRPVAIQCGQAPGPDAPVVSPDEGWRWRTAMLQVQTADATVHEPGVHLGRTHMVMEAVTIALHRQLPTDHPLFVLLSAHVDTTLAINHSAKTSLIAPGGTVDRVFAPTIEAVAAFVQAQVSTLDLAATAPAQELAARGVDDPTALPDYPYRDDALDVWGALAAFTADYVGVHYPDDASVAADSRLQAFVAELGAADGGRLRGVPPAQDRASLAFLLARLIFIAGPQHSAVNFSQFPNMGYIPNMCGALFTPPMREDTAVDEAFYTRTLSPLRVTVEDLTMIYLLSNVRASRFGEYGPLHFHDLASIDASRRFRERLDDVEARILTRDATRPWSYPYLRPSQILQSISI